MAKRARQRAETRGRLSEQLAALYLRVKGYHIRGTRIKTPVGEIDIIAERGGIMAFVEVKTRSSLDLALQSVSQQNWLRISRAADYWMARHPHLSDHGWRYDLIAIAPGRWPQHVRDAWRPGLA